MRSASRPGDRPARVVMPVASTPRPVRDQSAEGDTARSSTVAAPPSSESWSTVKVQRPGGLAGSRARKRGRRSEKLNSPGPVRITRSAGAVSLSSVSRISARTRERSDRRPSTRSMATRASGPSRSASRSRWITNRPVSRLRSTSSMLTARPVISGILATAARRTISGSVQTSPPSATRTMTPTARRTLRRRVTTAPASLAPEQALHHGFQAVEPYLEAVGRLA